MNLPYTKIDLREGTRVMVVTLLNRQLADLLDLGLQAKQAHWNVKGPQFASLHELFDQTAAAVTEFADLVAERAVQLGGLAEGTVETIAKNSRLPRYDVALYRDSDHLHALSSAMARFAATARSAIARAADAGDADTADILTQVSRGTDSLLWKVAAHIPEVWEPTAATSSPARSMKSRQAPARPRRTR